MLKIDIDIQGLNDLQKHIDFVQKLSKMKSDTAFQEYVSKWALNIVNQVAAERINLYPTSNEEMKTLYLQNNKIKDMSSNGFIIYNDLSVQSKNYTFCVALAFEYGTGIIGQEQAIDNAWEYNINENTVIINGEEVEGWWLSKEKAGNVQTFGESLSGNAIVTRGYQGMEIYRYSVEKIKSELKNMVYNYFNNGGVEND